MTNFFSLIKVQLLSFLSSNKLQAKKNKKTKAGFAGVALVLVIIGSAMVFFGYTYAQIFAISLSQFGEGGKLIPSMLAVACLLCFLFSFYSLGSALFGFKDYDMLMSMPLKPSEIVLSKFCVIYISELFFTLTIVVPSFFVYNSLIAPITAMQVISAFVMMLFSPLLPLAISTVIGVLVYYISSRFRRKNIIQLILLMIVMVGIMAFSFLSGYTEEDPALMLNSIGVLGKIYFIFPWALNAFFEPLWLLVFVATNILPIVAVILFVCLFYKRLNTIFTTKRTLRNFKLKEYQTNGLNKTLLNKEIKRIFSSPVYAMNCLFGIVLSLILSIAYSILVLVYDVSVDPEAEIVFWIIARLMPGVFGFMFLMAPLTSCSISMEGKAFWIIKTSPVSCMRVLNLKLLVHAIFNTTVAFICALSIGICTGFGWLATILFVLFAVALTLFSGVLGLLFNLRFPRLDWTNENTAVKQSLPVFLTMLVSFVSSGAMIAISIIFISDVSFEALLAIYAGFFIVLTVALYVVLRKCGEKMFNKLN